MDWPPNHEIKNLRTDEERQLRQMLLGAFGRIAKSAPRVAMRQAAPLIRRPTNIDPSESYAEFGIRSFGKGTFHKPALSGFDLGSKRIFRIEKGDLLLSNVLAWEGAIAVAKSEDDSNCGLPTLLLSDK
jgi:type I restriction enzyme, S subunit